MVAGAITFTLGIISGLIVYFLYNHLLKNLFDDFGKKIYSKIKKYQRGFSGRENIEDYFIDVQEFNSIDILVYQFGLRPKLPIIDVLYLEMLNKKLKNGDIKKILIFPTIDKTADTQQENDLSIFKENLEKIFKKNYSKIEIINPFRDFILTSKEIVSPSFIDSLCYLGSKDFFDQVHRISGFYINGIQDFNRYHVKERSILTLVTHVFKSWEVKNYILDLIDKSENDSMNIGFIFWEVEYDKWGIYDRASKDERINEVGLIIGKSIFSKTYRPLPVFTPNSIGIFEKKENIFAKISDYEKETVNSLIEIVSAILQSNYEIELSEYKALENGKSRIASLSSSSKHFIEVHDEVKDRVDKNKKRLFALILHLKNEYENK